MKKGQKKSASKRKEETEERFTCNAYGRLCIFQDTYMMMALIGSLVSCSGTKKGGVGWREWS